jgi:hypothetical protein
MDAEFDIVIDGPRLRFVYDDALATLLDLGRAEVRRASHVEPAAGGGWTADMGPVDGPVLGPFRLRGEALAAERRWLADHGF